MKKQFPIVLASSSPRRQFLMSEAGFQFTIQKPDVEEDFPEDMPVQDVAVFLARKKADYFRATIGDQVVITADTVVVLGSRILNKPQNRAEAIQMLTDLSGNTHTVITGVCIISRTKERSFQDETAVTFKSLTEDEIRYYVDTYRPYDKAGAYGAQDWIGMVAIHSIHGSYFNVMGLPIHRVYDELAKW
jgi:septum formation protein